VKYRISSLLLVVIWGFSCGLFSFTPESINELAKVLIKTLPQNSRPLIDNDISNVEVIMRVPSHALKPMLENGGWVLNTHQIIKPITEASPELDEDFWKEYRKPRHDLESQLLRVGIFAETEPSSLFPKYGMINYKISSGKLKPLGTGPANYWRNIFSIQRVDK
jgi:hypothetical protein